MNACVSDCNRPEKSAIKAVVLTFEGKQQTILNIVTLMSSGYIMPVEKVKSMVNKDSNQG